MPVQDDQKWFLRQWREARGLSQADVAERIGCDRTDVSKWERAGHPAGRRWNVDILNRMAAALEVEPWWLIRVDPSDPDNDLELLETLRRVPKESRAAAMRMLQALAEPASPPIHTATEQPSAQRRRKSD